MNRSTCTFVAIACAAVLPGTVAWAQPPDAAEMARRYGESARQNATLMQQYSWKMRSELTIKGEAKPAQIYQLRYDLDGKLQKTQVTAAQEPKKKRGIRGANQKGKIEDFQAWAAELADLVKGYMAPSPGTMMDFYGKATMSPSPDGTAQMSAGSFLQPGDKATFWVDKQTSAPVRFQFNTSLQGDPVEGIVEFGRVPNGPQYAARISVSVPAKKVTAKIENFDFVKQ
jgi:hypothetical protein